MPELHIDATWGNHMKFRLYMWAALAALLASPALAEENHSDRESDRHNDHGSDELRKIKTIVVIYAENRSFDNLYGSFPGADGLKNAQAQSLFKSQKDRDG
jgi:phospholipase C